MKFETVWLDRGKPSFDALPPHARDQVAALIDAICENPGMGTPDLMELTPSVSGPTLVATAGPAVVWYQVITDAEIIRPIWCAWRG